ncbi:MAG TPA: hypothetical protein VFK92_07420 [Burkholderiales bacterium]|nr:hypothetical protein [Burkholderiales bacterium]
MAGDYIKGYEGPEKPDSELAVVYTPRTEEAQAWLDGVDEVSYNAFLSSVRKAKILPGRRKISVHCVASNRSAYPSFVAVFEAGHAYRLICRQVSINTATGGVIDMGVGYPVPN